MELLGREGFSHHQQPTADGGCEVVFTRDAAGAAAGETAPTAPAPEVSSAFRLDARGLEPPEPMRRILEPAATLPPGGELLALTDRLPVYLLEQLTARGFAHRSEPQPDDSFLRDFPALQRHRAGCDSRGCSAVAVDI